MKITWGFEFLKKKKKKERFYFSIVNIYQTTNFDEWNYHQTNRCKITGLILYLVRGRVPIVGRVWNERWTQVIRIKRAGQRLMTLQRNAFPLKRCVGKCYTEGWDCTIVREEWLLSLNLRGTSRRITRHLWRKFRDSYEAARICGIRRLVWQGITSRYVICRNFFNKS